MATYVTRENIKAMGIPIDALVSPEQLDRITHHLRRILLDAGGTLHPEADARLAAATGGGAVERFRIGETGVDFLPDGTRREMVRDASGKWTARVERPDDAAPIFRDVKDGDRLPTLAPVALLEWLCPNIGRARAERIAPLLTGQAIDRGLFETVRRHWVAPTPAAEPAELRLVPNENGVGSRLVPSAPATIFPGDALDAIIIGGIRLACPTVESGSRDGFTLSARVDRETGHALQMVCSSGKPVSVSASKWTREASPLKFQLMRATFAHDAFDVSIEARWSAAPTSHAQAKAVDFTGAGATLTDGPEPRAKPAALAAGQVWLCGDTQWILDEQESKHPSFWNARTSAGQRGLLSAITVMGMRYLGTREEVAAREAGPSARAMRVGAAVAEGMARGVAMGMSRTPLGTMTAAPAPVPVVRDMLGSSAGAWLDAIAEQWYGVKRSAGETDDALRARCVATRDAPQPTNPSPLAALRAEIDRLIAADSGPFAHARAAALRCYGERPRPVNLDASTHASLIAGYLRQYEERRGGAARPNPDAYGAAEGWVGSDALATYERERSRSDVYARPLSRRGSR